MGNHQRIYYVDGFSGIYVYLNQFMAADLQVKVDLLGYVPITSHTIQVRSQIIGETLQCKQSIYHNPAVIVDHLITT